MCFHFTQSQEAQTLENRFQAEFIMKDKYEPPYYYNGFSFPETPIITNQDNTKIILAGWGLKPKWAKENWDKKYTLNARVETLAERASFKNITDNRCLIITDGFFEWQSVGEGKKKQKFKIDFAGDLFAFAGLFCIVNNEITYTIVTTEAKGIMREIHNTKFRMPYSLKTDKDFNQWLNCDEPEPQFDFQVKKLN